MMNNLRIRHEHLNQSERPFGVPGFNPDLVDEIIEKEERRIMSRRILCNTCMTYKSTSGSCFC